MAKEPSAVAQLVRLAPHVALRELAKQPEAQVPYTVGDTHAAMIARRIGLESDGEEGERRQGRDRRTGRALLWNERQRG